MGVMLRRAAQAIDVTDGWLWLMDPRGVMDLRVLQVEETKALPESALSGVRSVPGLDWPSPFSKPLAVARARRQMRQVFVLGVDDATLARARPRVLEGSVEDRRRSGALATTVSARCSSGRPGRLGRATPTPAEPSRLPTGAPQASAPPRRTLAIADRRATSVGTAEASAPFTSASHGDCPLLRGALLRAPQRESPSFASSCARSRARSTPPLTPEPRRRRR